MNTAADYAQIGTFFVALAALIMAYVQIASSKRSQREATAKDVFGDYLRLAFEYPQYAIPNPGLTSDDKYRWFVAVALNACDEILIPVLPDKGWQHVVQGILYDHREYLASKYFLEEDGGWEDYSKELKVEFVDLIKPRGVEFTATEIVVIIADGRKIATPLDWYPRLLRASAAQRADYEIMPMGIHWPAIDEDLSIAGMLKGQRAK